MHRGFFRAEYGLAAVVLAWLGLALPAPAAENDADLAQRVLALNDVTGNEPMEGSVKVLAEDPATAKKLLAAAEPLARDKKLNINAAYILAHTAQELKNLDAGRIFYRLEIAQAKQLQSEHQLATAYWGLLEILDENNKNEERLQVCQEILEMDEAKGPLGRMKSAVLEQVIQVMAQQGKIDEALKLADNLIKARPDDWQTLEVKALVLREANRNPEAAKIYEDLLDRISMDGSLKKDEKEVLVEACRSILSSLYIDMNRIDKATAQLKILLSEKPDSAIYNNELGFIWADHDMNLAEAEKMIRKALDEDRKERIKDVDLKPENDRDNAAYLDSLGWVLYKEKKYKEAKQYLLEAVRDKEEGQHAEIYDHLGDVLTALGEKAEAADAWKKAVDLAKPAKQEQERKAKIEKKIKDNQ